MRSGWLLGLLWVLSVVMLQAVAADENALQRLQRAATDMTQALEQAQRDIQNDRQRLEQAELNLTSGTITTTALEDARLELAALRSRESGLNTRLQARRSGLTQLNTEIDTVQARLQSVSSNAAEVSVLRERHESLLQQRSVLEDLLDKLERLHQRYETRATLARQRFDLLQARFELPDLETLRRSSSRAGQSLQREIDNLLANASEARRAAAKLGQDSARDKAQRRLLELQALDAEERAELQQLSLARLQVQRVLQSLSVFSGARATPVRVLKSALHNIEKMHDELLRQRELVELKRNQFQDQRQIIHQQGAIATGVDSTFTTRITLIDQLLAVTDQQLTEITALLKKIQTTQESLRAAATSNAGAELTSRRELPADIQSWRQLAHNLTLLPIRVGQALQRAMHNLLNTFVQRDWTTRILSVLVCLAILVGIWQLRRWLSQQLQNIDPAEGNNRASVWTPLKILQRNLWGLFAPLLLVALGFLLQLRQADFILLLAPLLIWPVVKLSLAFVNNLLDEYTPELDPSRTRLLILETRWVVIVAAVLAAVLVTAHTVALSPSVIDVIDRLSMLCLLLIALPLIHLRKLVLEGIHGSVRSRVLRGISLALPALLVVCALIGIAGYINLAWAIAIRLGWLLMVGLGVHIVRMILRGLFQSTIRWFERRDAESAPYWEQYILGPFYRITVLLVVVAAAQILFYLYHWNAQTPIVRAIPLLLDSTLFSVGETAIKLKTLALALLTLFVAVWGAGWSKQVSYRWLYTGVQDQGIRSSLSTFTQYLVVVLGLVVAMKIIGLDLTALTVFAGALGVGIGFGMQTIVVNFISGILLLIERPLSTTDLVNVDKYEGEVTRIGIRSLTVKTFDNQEVIIPNSSVITKPFTNWTRSDDIMRTLLMIGISYTDDPHQAVALIMDVVKAHPAVLADPGPKVLLWDYGESALMIRVQFHTRIRGTIGRADTRSQILFSIWDEFKTAGITIPYPQRDVHLYREE